MWTVLRGLVIGFVVLLAFFRTLELGRSPGRRMPVVRAGFWTDVAYWAITPLTSRIVALLGGLLATLPVLLLIYGKLDFDLLKRGFGPVSELPLWIQGALIVIVGDFVGYWTHRWFHTPGLWRFHAVHHSSIALDWLSAVRVHPINEVMARALGAAPVLAIGAAPSAVAGALPLLTAFAILLHANIDWDWGPLRAVVASPRFHRWHHTCEADGLNKNFAGLLPLWDLLFGTYFMPEGRRPEQFGADLPVPKGLLGQLAFPFGKGGQAMRRRLRRAATIDPRDDAARIDHGSSL